MDPVPIAANHGAPMRLAYAGKPARHGITYGSTRDGYFMSIRVPAWRRVLAAALGIPLIVTFVAGWIFGLTALLVVLIVGWFSRRFFKPIEIEITPEMLVIRNLDSNPSVYEAPRKDVYDVRYVAHSGKVAVHAHHREMLELRPLTDVEMLRWIAEQLRLALGIAAASSDA